MATLIENSEQVQALNWRYATKKFDGEKKISELQLDDLLENTRLSASSFGLQPYRLVVVSNKGLREKLKAVSYNQAQITDASHLIVFAATTNLDDKYVDEFINLIARSRGIDASSLTEYADSMKYSINSKDLASRISWAARQAYIGIGTLLFSAAVSGVDACPMEGFLPDEYDQILGLKEENLTTFAVVTLGYRSEDDSYQHYKKVRYPAEEFILRK